MVAFIKYYALDELTDVDDTDFDDDGGTDETKSLPVNRKRTQDHVGKSSDHSAWRHPMSVDNTNRKDFGGKKPKHSNLYVWSIPRDMDEQQLSTLFQKFGNVIVCFFFCQI